MAGCSLREKARPWLQLFGTWRLLLRDRPVPVRRNEQRLLTLLALRGRQPRVQVSGILWPDSSEGQATGSLRSAIWRLRHSVPWALSVRQADLALGDDVEVDVDVLRRTAHALVADNNSSPEDAERAARLVAQAGELLPGWFDDWVLIERERFRQLRVHALEAHAVRLAAGHRYAAALEAAFTVLTEEPFRESPHRMIARIHLAEGNINEAIRAYQLYHRLLGEEITQQVRSRQTGGAFQPPTMAEVQRWLIGH